MTKIIISKEKYSELFAMISHPVLGVEMGAFEVSVMESKTLVGTVLDMIWWKLIPGVKIKVKWPCGEIVAGPGPSDPRWRDWGGAAYIKFPSADPNDHYRPWLEKNVGKQGWDWDWKIVDRDLSTDQLTIKFRLGKEQYASIVGIMWT